MNVPPFLFARDAGFIRSRRRIYSVRVSRHLHVPDDEIPEHRIHPVGTPNLFGESELLSACTR